MILHPNYTVHSSITMLFGDKRGNFSNSEIYFSQYIDNVEVTKQDGDNRDDFLAHNLSDGRVELTYLTDHGLKVSERVTCPKNIFAHDYTDDGRSDIISLAPDDYVWL